MMDSTQHSQPIQKSDAIYKIVTNHAGEEMVLYKTYAQSDSARKALEAATDQNAVLENMSKAKIGSSFKTADGQTEVYGLSQLVEFQGTGLVVVILVLSGLSVMSMLMSALLRKLGLTEEAAPKAAVQPSKAVVSVASSKPSIHPGIPDEQLIAMLTLVTSQMVGKEVSIVKFRPLTDLDWTWTVQGRVALHSKRLV